VHLKADNNLPHCTITEKLMTRNSKTKTKNLRSTGSRQEAIESVVSGVSSGQNNSTKQCQLNKHYA